MSELIAALYPCRLPRPFAESADIHGGSPSLSSVLFRSLFVFRPLRSHLVPSHLSIISTPRSVTILVTHRRANNDRHYLPGNMFALSFPSVFFFLFYKTVYFSLFPYKMTNTISYYTLFSLHRFPFLAQYDYTENVQQIRIVSC